MHWLVFYLRGKWQIRRWLVLLQGALRQSICWKGNKKKKGGKRENEIQNSKRDLSDNEKTEASSTTELSQLVCPVSSKIYGGLSHEDWMHWATVAKSNGPKFATSMNEEDLLECDSC